MVPKLFVFSKDFWFLHFHRLPCELENARVLYKIKRKFAFFSVNTKYISSRNGFKYIDLFFKILSH